MTALFSSPRANGSGQARLQELLYERFLWVVRAGAQRAARQAVGPAVFPAPAFHGRSAHQPRWPNRRPAGCPPIPD